MATVIFFYLIINLSPMHKLNLFIDPLLHSIIVLQKHLLRPVHDFNVSVLTIVFDESKKSISISNNTNNM